MSDEKTGRTTDRKGKNQSAKIEVEMKSDKKDCYIRGFESGAESLDRDKLPAWIRDRDQI